MATKEKIERVQLWTPPGRFSFPFLASVDSGRQYSDDAYKTDLLIPKAIFKEFGKEIQDAVLKVGRDKFGKDFKLQGSNYHVPFKDTDKDEAIENEAMKGAILVRGKAGPNKQKKTPARQPVIFGPRKVEGKFQMFTAAEIQNIKGGDWGKLEVAVFAYEGNKQIKPGVSFYLNAVQFWKEGDAFGQGRSRLMETAEELETELEDIQGSGAGQEATEEMSESIV